MFVFYLYKVELFNLPDSTRYWNCCLQSLGFTSSSHAGIQEWGKQKEREIKRKKKINQQETIGLWFLRYLICVGRTSSKDPREGLQELQLKAAANLKWVDWPVFENAACNRRCLGNMIALQVDK